MHDTANIAGQQVPLSLLAPLNEIAEPVAAALASAVSRRIAMFSDPGAFWRSVSEAPQIRQLTHGTRLAEISMALPGKPTALTAADMPVSLRIIRSVCVGALP